MIYTLSNGDRGQTGNINTASDGLFNHNVNGWKLLDGSDHTDEAMLKLGWEKYYLHTDNKWYRKRKYGGQTEIKKLVDITGYEMSEMGVEFLRPGDLLCYGKHAEFYIGYNYNVTYNNMISSDINVRNRSGISSIKIGDKAQQGHVTFGWGGVQSRFPKENNYFKFNNNCFNWYRSSTPDGEGTVSRHNDDNGNVIEYKAIWRKN